MVYNYFFAQGKWDDRKTLNYTKMGERDSSGVEVDAYGNHLNSSAAGSGVAPALVHIEQSDDVIFMKYANNNVVIKVTKEA